MYQIKTPAQFVTTPWKNGLGETTELAINEGGTLNNFDWRLSMAKVTEDGAFSNFSGYLRQLILIKGAGITLEHQFEESNEPATSQDVLNNVLDFATFDGANQTSGKLHQGRIVDFNVITNPQKLTSRVQTFIDVRDYKLPPADINFIYAHSGELSIRLMDCNEKLMLQTGELFHLQQLASEEVHISGENAIVIQFSYL